MIFRHTQIEELDNVMVIIEEARKYFKVNGIPQWQNGTPNKETITKDIEAKVSYVLVDEDEIVGTCAVMFEEEPTYAKIEQGRWLNEYDYAVIHRLAVKQSYKGHGYGSNLLEGAAALAKKMDVDNLRIDTHRLNTSMQRLIAKNNFFYCGIIYLEDGAERLAYQKTC